MHSGSANLSVKAEEQQADWTDTVGGDDHCETVWLWNNMSYESLKIPRQVSTKPQAEISFFPRCPSAEVSCLSEGIACTTDKLESVSPND